MPAVTTTPTLAAADITPGAITFETVKLNVATTGNAIRWRISVWSNPGDTADTTPFFQATADVFSLSGTGWMELWTYTKTPGETVLSPQGSATNTAKLASWQAILNAVGAKAETIMSA